MIVEPLNLFAVKLRIAAEALTAMAGEKKDQWMEQAADRSVAALNRAWKDTGMGVFMVPVFYAGRMYGAQHSYSNDEYWLLADRGRLLADCWVS